VDTETPTPEAHAAAAVSVDARSADVLSLDVLSGELDRLSRVDPRVFADADSVVAAQRMLAQAEALVTRITGAFDASGNWAPDGARTASAWLSVRCRIPKVEARRQVRRGRALHSLPEVEQAWSQGAISGAHVEVMATLSSEETGAALARDEAVLVAEAGRLRFDQFCQVAAYWKQLADPQAADREAEARRARRDVYLVNSFAGTWLGAMTLDPISGAIVSGELERLEQTLFEADWAQARDALGRDPAPTELARTSGQRRADALVEMATRSKGARTGARRPAPMFTVLVGWETLTRRICQLEDGTAVTPGTLLPWLDRADLERAVFAPGRRVEISPRARLFTGATRRAIEVRDRECTHPFCDVVAPFCQHDHIIPWALGGPTTQENGRLLCSDHNLERTQRPPPAA
jgi:Domain of unknown function (DUF222)/HNH endonuclease